MQADEELVLTVDEARKLPDAELRRRFRSIADDLVATFGAKSLPAIFSTSIETMARDELLAAVQQQAYWLDPRGGHPAPDESPANDN